MMILRGMMEKSHIDDDEIIVDEYHGKSSKSLSAALISTQEILTTNDVNMACHNSQQSTIVDRNVVSHLSTVIPTDKDVLCGRGKAFFHHEGNKIFRKIVDNMIGRYLKAERKSEKSKIVIAISDEVMKTGARFLKRKEKGNDWYEGGINLARQKVSIILGLPCKFSIVCVQLFLTEFYY
jgi:hypothetical protein